jgi:polysaccharide deacetylase family protein (PEP-CTERM system associated)
VSGIAGALTVDVEEWFQVENLREAAPPARWEGLEARAEAATARLLDLLDERAVRATFFVLGWVAARRPRLVERIAARGHEVASHGFGHEMLHALDPARFREDLRAARAALEDAGQRKVEGYRAPTWSIDRRTEWALDVLIDEGYRYDSSVFPVRHDRYGDPDAPVTPHRRRRAGGSIVELPPLVFRALGANWPAAGGGYLRLFPLAFVRRAIAQAVREGRPAVIYLHPWEIDPEQPRLAVGVLRRLRHYGGLAGVERKLRAILGEHRFARAVDLVEAFEAAERPAEAAAAPALVPEAKR